jgi:large conductance mechanosensitive channel
MKKFLDDFKKFALRGNVIDLAVGVIIGAAFGKIVTSLVNDIFMPLISLLAGGVSFTDKFIVLKGGAATYNTLADAQAAGVATLNYGLFIQAIIDFILMALCVFIFVKLISKLHKKEAPAPAAPAPRLCPYCVQPVDAKATRCPHCTSELKK